VAIRSIADVGIEPRPFLKINFQEPLMVAVAPEGNASLVSQVDVLRNTKMLAEMSLKNGVQFRSRST
jgi:hypothetical protein